LYRNNKIPNPYIFSFSLIVMLDDFTLFWFGVLQGIGGIGTVAALIFVGLQSMVAKKQLGLMERELILTLRPWIYRDPNPGPPRDPRVPDYEITRDPDRDNEMCIRIPFHNQGQFHSSSLIYYHMFMELDKVELTAKDLKKIKENVKDKKYRVIGERVIVPGSKFGKRFHIATKKLGHYLDDNPVDSEILDKYYKGSTIYLVILLQYTYGLNGVKGEYGGILKLEKRKPIHKNEDWIKEWVK
jgi:hypothetical protein